jgi:hypothetical protein
MTWTPDELALDDEAVSRQYGAHPDRPHRGVNSQVALFRRKATKRFSPLCHFRGPAGTFLRLCRRVLLRPPGLLTGGSLIDHSREGGI